MLDHLGRQLGDREFPTTPAGYRALLGWMGGHGQLERIGVEGTGTYGAALARQLRAAGVQVVEVDRPDRKARRVQGKSDPLDAYSAARSALAGEHRQREADRAEEHRERVAELRARVDELNQARQREADRAAAAEQRAAAAEQARQQAEQALRERANAGDAGTHRT